jgi:hypothetical protein
MQVHLSITRWKRQSEVDGIGRKKADKKAGEMYIVRKKKKACFWVP